MQVESLDVMRTKQYCTARIVCTTYFETSLAQPPIGPCRFITHYYPPHIIHHSLPTENTLYTPRTEWNGMRSDAPCRMKALSNDYLLNGHSIRIRQSSRYWYYSNSPDFLHAAIRAVETGSIHGGGFAVECGHRCPQLLCIHFRRGRFDTDAPTAIPRHTKHYLRELPSHSPVFTLRFPEFLYLYGYIPYLSRKKPCLQHCRQHD